MSSTIEPMESRVMLAATAVRTFDGTGNNLAHPTWGSAATTFLRIVAANYADGVSAPAGASRPSARAISNAVAAHPVDTDVLNDRNMAAFVYAWGQFIDHDLDLTNTATGAFNIAVPTGDAFFDPLGTGTQVIPLTRSQYVTDANGVRQQVNSITAYIDGSMVYGSSESVANSLRTFTGGKMLTSTGGLLPLDPTNPFNFVAGDVRVNENVELTSVQSLFIREHNRLAGQIAVANPSWTDEQIFQQARRLVIGEIQSITYNEFLPALLGPSAIPRYAGYNANVNVGITNEFSTAAFRLGHSMLADDVEFITNDGEDAFDELALKDAFFNPDLVRQRGIDSVLKYLASSNSEEIDTYIVDGLRNFLFGQPGQGGFDLASLNVQRGRDHGLADYNTTRAALGLARVTSFSQITSDPAIAAALQSVYGSVDNVDLWVGGLAENHVRGGSVGPTFQRILVDQFTRLRDGDRFWYERDLSGRDLAMVRSTSLADVISANASISNLQDNVFVFDVQVTGRIWADGNANRRQDREENGVGGVTVQLIDEDGVVADTTKTDRDGSYRFADLQIGDYVVKPVGATGMRWTTPATASIDVTRGMSFNDVSFGVQNSSQGGPTTPPRPGPTLPRRDGPDGRRLVEGLV